MTAPPLSDATALNPPMGERPVRGPEKLSGVVVFAQEIDRTQHVGRHIVRQSVLAMPPAGGGRVPRPRTPTGHGAFWGIAAANGLTLALSLENFSTIGGALSDADRVFHMFEQLTFHPRRAGVNSTAVWIALDGRVIMVSGGTYKGMKGDQRLRRALRAAWLPGADNDLGETASRI